MQSRLIEWAVGAGRGGVTFTGLVLIARGPQQGWAAVVL